MKRIRVLIACSGENANPYIFQLIRALENHPSIEAVQHGIAWLRVPEVAFDVVHIQWPEALTRWREPSKEDFRFLESVFHRWKSQKTAIVTTIHNEFPHGSHTESNKRLYELVFRNADAMVHLGERSKVVVQNRYGKDEDRVFHRVIPHGNYQWYSRDAPWGNARAQLGLPEDIFILLSFGRIRHRGELRLLLQAANCLKTWGGRLVIAGRLPHNSKKTFKYAATRLPVWLSSNVALFEQFVPDEKVSVFFEASDALFVPRVDALNSGNVALGYTFGKVVAGPDTGVIGEELQRLGNPTFDPHSKESIKQAVERARELSGTEQGNRNKEYAKTSLNWQRAADLHVEVYSRLLQWRDR